MQCAEFNLQITDYNYNAKSAMFRVTEYSMQEGNLLTAMCRVQCAESRAQSPECMCKVQCEMQRPIHGIQCTKSAMHRIQLPENVESAKRVREPHRQTERHR